MLMMSCRGTRLLGAPGGRLHLMARLQQQLDAPGAQEARAARDADRHGARIPSFQAF